jgi:hypothetical protein
MGTPGLNYLILKATGYAGGCFTVFTLIRCTSSQRNYKLVTGSAVHFSREIAEV